MKSLAPCFHRLSTVTSICVLASIVVAAAAALMPPQRQFARNENVFVAKQNTNKPMGNLKWAITEGKTGKVLGKGEKKLTLKDIVIAQLGGNGSFVSKRIDLGNHFRMDISDQPSPTKAISGFGLTADRDDRDTFSWDWFNVDSANHATKIQESGELGITIAKTGAGWEVTRIKFLTDVSLRIIILGEDAPGSDARWRVKILKGSTITWPSLVNGKVVPN